MTENVATYDKIKIMMKAGFKFILSESENKWMPKDCKSYSDSYLNPDDCVNDAWKYHLEKTISNSTPVDFEGQGIKISVSRHYEDSKKVYGKLTINSSTSQTAPERWNFIVGKIKEIVDSESNEDDKSTDRAERIEEMKSWTVGKPCRDYPRKRLVELCGGKESLTVLEILELDIPTKDRVWAALQDGDHVLVAVEKIVTRAVTNHALKCGIPKVEQWAKGWLDGNDRSWDAARAVWDVVRAAADAARAAWDAAAAAAAQDAADAAWAAAWDAELELQIEDIKKACVEVYGPQD